MSDAISVIFAFALALGLLAAAGALCRFIVGLLARAKAQRDSRRRPASEE